MIASPSSPFDRFYESQGLRLHYADWGNETAPPLILVHGGRDHCRNWDALARALQPQFHVVTPDLRGHGDSEWTKGGSYSLSDYVYDLTRLMGVLGLREAAFVGHSMGGMVCLVLAGTFSERVTRLAVLDGITVLPGLPRAPIHERIAKWVMQLDKMAESKPRRLADLAEAAKRMLAHNKHLSPELAEHLARHAAKKNPDGTYSWKFDEYGAARAPYRLSPEDHVALWQRITCPTLLLRGDETFMPDWAPALPHLKTARAEIIRGAGHWLHHDKLDEVLALLRPFLVG
jgi:pimeloyl-ACP methyl ester carboxylesterase